MAKKIKVNSGNIRKVIAETKHSLRAQKKSHGKPQKPVVYIHGLPVHIYEMRKRQWERVFIVVDALKKYFAEDFGNQPSLLAIPLAIDIVKALEPKKKRHARNKK